MMYLQCLHLDFVLSDNRVKQYTMLLMHWRSESTLERPPRYLDALSRVLSFLQYISSILYCFTLLSDSTKSYYLIPRTARNVCINKFVSSILYCFTLVPDSTKLYYMILQTARNKCTYNCFSSILY